MIRHIITKFSFFFFVGTLFENDQLCRGGNGWERGITSGYKTLYFGKQSTMASILSRTIFCKFITFPYESTSAISH